MIISVISSHAGHGGNPVEVPYIGLIFFAMFGLILGVAVAVGLSDRVRKKDKPKSSKKY